jgi:hypothetical protein
LAAVVDSGLFDGTAVAGEKCFHQVRPDTS